MSDIYLQLFKKNHCKDAISKGKKFRFFFENWFWFVSEGKIIIRGAHLKQFTWYLCDYRIRCV